MLLAEQEETHNTGDLALSQEKKDGRIVIKGDAARELLLEGARKVYEVVTTTYGPKGRNVLAEKPFGYPVLTRDGVTVARETYFSERSTNMGAQFLLESAEKSNSIAGDGTSATIALAYHLLRNGDKAIKAGMHPMTARETINADAELMLAELNKLAKPVKKGQLKQVATVSSGDALLGELIAGAVEHVGPSGGVNIEKAPLENVEREIVQGFYLQSGFQALQAGKKELIEPNVIVLQRRIASAMDIGEVLTKVAAAKQLQPGRDAMKFLIIGNLDATGYTHVIDLINRGGMDAIVIKTPPQFGEMGNQLLEDIAVYAGCEPITDSTNLRTVGEEHVGTIEKVVASKYESTLYGDADGELVQDRIADLKSQIESEIGDAVVEKLRDRVAKLEGKVALIRVGGRTESEKEELEFRIEDAVNATRAADKAGVVAGGGMTLLALSKLKDLSPISRCALQDVFRQLLDNAGLSSELKLHEALSAKPGFGYNLRAGDELTDLVEAGILDPKLVVEQVIKNASSVAGNALTTDVLLTFESKEA
jgi:chaperonin GroEL